MSHTCVIARAYIREQEKKSVVDTSKSRKQGIEKLRERTEKKRQRTIEAGK